MVKIAAPRAVSATGLRLVYIKVEFSLRFATYTLSSGANLDRFSTRFLRPLPDRPKIMTLAAAGRSAGAGGQGAGHCDRGDVGPLAAGPSETAHDLFSCFLWVPRKERRFERSVRVAVVGDAGIDPQASPKGTVVEGRPAVRAAPRRRHIASAADG